MRYKLLSALLFLGLVFTNNLWAQSREVLGEIVGSSENDIYIEFPVTANPASNQVLNVLWIPDGSRIEVGKVRIVSSEDGFATAQLLEGQASIGMKVSYQQSSTNNDTTVSNKTAVSNKNATPPVVTQPASVEQRSIDPQSVDGQDDDEVGEALNIDTSWAYSMVNAGQWVDQSFLSKSNALAQYSRAVAASGGKSERSQKNALRLFLKSARKGYRLSQYRVGWMLENGLGTDKNLTLALAWYQIAAAKGHKKAALGMSRLGGEQQ